MDEDRFPDAELELVHKIYNSMRYMQNPNCASLLENVF
jgi:hypothetical protein